ncbi:MAG: low molecular weight protein tyrosine phosphatase family protein [Paracoccaceae bacterium]
MRVLFVCGRGRARSPTAAQVFADWPGVSTDFGGVSPDADDVLSADQIEWADLIVAMENRHRTRLSERYRAAMRGRRVVVLGVPDRYAFMAPDLVTVLRERAGPHLR